MVIHFQESNEITVLNNAFFISLNTTSVSSPPATSLKDIMEQEQSKGSSDVSCVAEVRTLTNYASINFLLSVVVVVVVLVLVLLAFNIPNDNFRIKFGRKLL